ncbi:hypothetical protein SAMN03080601_01937 [Alkalitalea saponilacus]|uniref:Uncharacterized protein n=1 Tax=Alkalitalea saponilacus TaxID=889453 RepID=A0A1T5GRV7_9BACT|nr:hypothetical protein SAMN03080601_01937 [Alkalitalea saponilacus]
MVRLTGSKDDEKIDIEDDYFQNKGVNIKKRKSLISFCSKNYFVISLIPYNKLLTGYKL